MTNPLDPRGWALWRNQRSFVVAVCAVFVAAAICMVPLQPSGSGDLTRFLVLALVGSLCVLTCVRMERARKFIEAENAPNLVATWTFAAALTLDHVWATAMVALVYLLQWRAERKLHVGRPHRYVFGAATVVIAVRCSQFVHGPILAGAVLLAVNMGLVAAVLVVSGNARDALRMANLRQQGVEVGTLVLGWAMAALFQWHTLAIIGLVPVLIGVQYLALTLSIRQPSTFDRETGVLTARAWNALSVLRLAQTKEAVLLQLVMPDAVADRSAECATILRESVRPEDLIGRTSDGFSILVAGSGDEVLAELLGLQMRARLAVCGMDTYVGFAVTPDRGKPVDLQGLAVTASADVIVKAANIRV
jgi:hypothetical protein